MTQTKVKTEYEIIEGKDEEEIQMKIDLKKRTWIPVGKMVHDKEVCLQPVICEK